MARGNLRVGVILLIVTSGALLASCMTLRSFDQPTVEVDVQGTPRQLARFDRAVREHLGKEPLTCAVVDVEGQPSDCGVLHGNAVPPATAKHLMYEFFSPLADVFERLGEAFDEVQERHSRGVSMAGPYANSSGVSIADAGSGGVSIADPYATPGPTVTVNPPPAAAYLCTLTCPYQRACTMLPTPRCANIINGQCVRC